MKKASDAPSRSREETQFRFLLWTLALAALVNLLFTASLVGLIGSIIIWIMVWGIKKGDYPLTRALAVFLFLYAAGNLVVLGTVLLFQAEAKTSALIWLGFYSVLLVVLGLLLRSKTIQSYLKTAKPPEEKEKKIHFFHGGWRDL